MEIFITFFILVANVVGLLLVYHSFDNRIEKNKKLMYTMICFGIMYIITLITYFFSSIGIDNKNVSNSSKDMITFTFVPINTIIILPILIKSFNNRKMNKITKNKLNKTAILMFLITLILIVLEFFCFRNMQKGIINIFNDKQNKTNVNTQIENNQTNTDIEQKNEENANLEYFNETNVNIENSNLETNIEQNNISE